MNIFIVFFNFFGWIVAIWVRLVRFILEKRGQRFWKGLTTKIKNIITKKKKKDPRGLRPPPESVPTISLSIYVSKKEDSLVSEKGTAIIN